MATKLFLRSTTDNGIGSTYQDMITTAGASAATAVVNTVASGTEIQWTASAGGAVVQWISGRAPAGGFTLSGQMTFSLWAKESNAKANCGIRCRIFKRTAAGVESEISSGWAYGSPTEITNSNAEYSWNGTPASTAFAENDRILLKAYIINVGTMASGYTCTLTYNDADAATGDSFLQINETITFKGEVVALTQGISGSNEQLTQSDAQLLGHGLIYDDPSATSFADAHSEGLYGFQSLDIPGEALALTDDVSILLKLFIDNPETVPLSLSDSFATFAAWFSQPGDTLTISDGILALFLYLLETTDSLSLGDQIELIAKDIITCEDTVSLSDAIELKFSTELSTGDSLSLSDDAQATIAVAEQTVPLEVVASDNFELTDSIAGILDYFISDGDIVVFSDEYQGRYHSDITNGDDINSYSDGVNSSLSGEASLSVTASDLLSLVDAAGNSYISFVGYPWHCTRIIDHFSDRSF